MDERAASAIGFTRRLVEFAEELAKRDIVVSDLWCWSESGSWKMDLDNGLIADVGYGSLGSYVVRVSWDGVTRFLDVAVSPRRMSRGPTEFARDLQQAVPPGDDPIDVARKVLNLE